MKDHGIPRPARPPLGIVTAPEKLAQVGQDDERVPSLHSTTQASLCALCRSRIPAGRLRPWVDAGQPMCRTCTTSRGLADVEAILDALTVARRLAPVMDPAVSAGALLGAASAWAMHRLTTWISETLEGHDWCATCGRTATPPTD